MKEKNIITGEKAKSPVKDEVLEKLLQQQIDTGNDKAVNDYLKSK